MLVAEARVVGDLVHLRLLLRQLAEVVVRDFMPVIALGQVKTQREGLFLGLDAVVVASAKGEVLVERALGL